MRGVACDEAVVQKEVKKPTAEDPSNSIAPKELQVTRVFLWVFLWGGEGG